MFDHRILAWAHLGVGRDKAPTLSRLGLELDLRTRRCRCNDREISLSSWETRVLEALIRCEHGFVTTRELLDIHVAPRIRLGPAQAATLLARLRNRLSTLGSAPHIVEVQGRGIALARRSSYARQRLGNM